jgi:hypothetical protein
MPVFIKYMLFMIIITLITDLKNENLWAPNLVWRYFILHLVLNLS